MGFIDKIRQKPHEQKVRIMWTVSIVFVILLIIVWIISAHYDKNVAKDTTLFQSIGQGFHDVRQNFHK